VNYMLRTLVLAAVATLGYLGYFIVQDVLDARDLALAEQREQIQRLEGDLAESEARVAELETALRYMKIDHRRARLTVVDQRVDPTVAGGVETTVRFEELDEDGAPIGEGATYTLPGKVAYLESLVIKFEDSFVEQGDAFRGSSLCLFRRLFSEVLSPEEGVVLDPVGETPEPYSDDRDLQVLDRLWLRFWDYANDPAAAAEAGVRAIHGEAPFIEMRPGARYIVELRASGGLSLRAE